MIVVMAAQTTMMSEQIAAAGCQFPSSVQTNVLVSGVRRHQANHGDISAAGKQHHHHSRANSSRDWVTRILDQFTEFQHQVVISGNIIRTVTPSGVDVFSRVCIRVVQGDRYLVAHEEPGQKGQRYTCLQFVHRSDDVVQVREAPISTRMDRMLCRDSKLQLNRWLLVDRSRINVRHSGSTVECPLFGGFSMHIFDKVRTSFETLFVFYLSNTPHRSKTKLLDRYKGNSLSVPWWM